MEFAYTAAQTALAADLATVFERRPVAAPLRAYADAGVADVRRVSTTAQLEDAIARGVPCVTDDAVYFACDNGYLVRLNRADGKEVWRYDLGDARVPRVLQEDVARLAPQPRAGAGRAGLGGLVARQVLAHGG